MPDLELYFFGPVRFKREGEAVEIGLSRVKALLAYLMLSGAPQSRDALAALFWPESDESSARGSLRRTLYRLNKEVGDELVVATPDAVTRNPDSDVWIDVEAFQAYAAQGLAGAERERGKAGWIALLEQAVALYRADFLAGFTLPDAPDFDEWQFFQRETLRRSLAGVLIALATAYQEQGDWERAIGSSRRWLALDPLHEPAHRHLMQLYALSGQTAAAQRQYEECVRLLEEELGVEPEEETTALFAAIRARELAPLAAAAPPAPSPPALVPDVPAPIVHNLSVETTPFVGRQAELAVLHDYLLHPDVRLVTIVGPGGMGKTRLALAAASQMLPVDGQEPGAPYAGVYFVSLAPLATSDQLAPAIADAVGFSLETDADERRHSRQQLVDYLREKRMLLVLDNFEHLLDGSDLITEIIQTALGVNVLVTSRQRLALREEHLLVIPGLDYPLPPLATDVSVDRIAAFAAVQLFVQAARRLQHDFVLAGDNARAVAEICYLVEGMPLALELAAAWVEVLPLAEIAAEIRKNLDFLESDIRNVPRRQRSMRAVFDTTWQLLGQDEQEIFARLSVFRGGFTREAVEALTGTSLRLLTRLADKALLQFDRVQNRYYVHELLRQYAGAKLAEDPEGAAETYHRHSDYYCCWLQDMEPALKGAQQERALAALEMEADNVQLAWSQAVQQEQWALLQDTMDALGYSLELLGRSESGKQAFQRALSQVRADGWTGEAAAGERRLLARLLGWQAVFDYLLGAPHEAEQLLQEALALLQGEEMGDLDTRADHAFVYWRLGIVATHAGSEHANACFERSLALWRELGRPWESSEVLARMGRWAHVLADFQQAERLFEESLSLKRELGDRRGTAEVLGALSQESVELGRFEHAERLARESNAIYRELGNRFGMAAGLRQLGVISMWLGEHEEAHEQLAQCLGLARELGNHSLIANASSLYGLALSLVGRHEEAKEHGHTGLALMRQHRDANLIAWSLWTYGWILTSGGDLSGAEVALRESVSVFRKIASEATIPRQLGWSLSLLSYVLWRQGQRDEARELLLELLPISIRLADVLPLLTAIPTIALILVDQGEAERATELYALIWRFGLAANARGWLEKTGEELEAVAAALPAEARAAATARAESFGLQHTASELLSGLAALA
jgi:predicted ATPase/DNA-binding SARP family transcriptional activator